MSASLMKLSRWLGLAILGLVVSVALMAAAVAILAPRIDLEGLRPRLEALASEALGRSVELRGPLALVLSLPPALEIAGLRIGNPAGWQDGHFASLGSARAVVQMTPLLRNELRVEEITLDRVRVELETDAAGRDNWLFPGPAGGPAGREPAWRLVEIKQVALTDAFLGYRDRRDDKTLALELHHLEAQLPARAPMRLAMQGGVEGLPLSIRLRTGTLAELTEPGAWPVEAVIRLDDHHLDLRGSIAEPFRYRQLDMSGELRGEKVEDLAAVFGMSLPAIGQYRLAGRLRGDAGRLMLSGLQGRAGASTFSGELAVKGLSGQAGFSGSLLVPVLDPAPWLQADTDPDRPRSGSQLPATLPALPPGKLRLEVREVLNLPVTVRDIGMDLQLDGRDLTAPLRFTLADVALTGQLGWQIGADEHRGAVELQSRHVDAGRLFAEFTDLVGIEGRADSLRLSASSHGASAQSLLKNLGLQVALQGVAMSYGNLPGEDPVAMDIDTANFTGPPGEEANLVVTGALLGEPLTASLQLGSLPVLMTERRIPVALHAAGAGAQLRVAGQLAGPGSAEDTRLEVELAAEELGKLAPWLGVSEDASAALALSGELWVRNDRDAWEIRDLMLRLGGSSVQGMFGVAQRRSDPLVKASLAFDVIDPFELERLLTGVGENEKKKAADGPDLDMPIFPRGMALDDMDIDVAVQRLKLDPSDITDISFSTSIRDGYVSSAPFAGTMAETSFTGDLALDLRGEAAVIGLKVEASQVDVGKFLRDLELATEIDAYAEKFGAALRSRGSSISEIFGNTQIDVETRAGRWLLFAAGENKGIEITVKHGTGKADTSQRRSEFRLDAAIGDVPLDFTLETQRLPDPGREGELLALKIDAQAAGAELAMQGVMPRLSGGRDLDLDMTLQGESIETLSELLDVSLPPFGPYQAKGHLRIDESSFAVSDIELRVGSSTLAGGFTAVTAGARAMVDIDLRAETFQIDDFKVGDWEPVERPGSTGEKGEPPASVQDDTDEPRELLGQEVMRGVDLTGRLEVGRVLSGADVLGSGVVSMELKDGRLDVPAHLDISGGVVDLALALRATEPGYEGRLQAKVDNFDYGVFARRIKPETDMQGRFSLDLELQSRGERFDLLDDNAGGHFDFVIWPDTLKAGVFDMWTANLFFALLPVLDPEATSRVNCIVGRFNMQDGVMKPRPLFMDTTRSQVSGRGEINFRSDRLYLRLTPISKRPKFFSVSTPVVVEGSFSDFGINLRPHDLIGTVIRFVYTGIVVPFQYLTRGVKPDFDVKECKKALGVAGREPEAPAVTAQPEQEEFDEQ